MKFVIICIVELRIVPCESGLVCVDVDHSLVVDTTVLDYRLVSILKVFSYLYDSCCLKKVNIS